MAKGKGYAKVDKEEIEVGLAILFIAIGLGIVYSASQYYNAPVSHLVSGVSGISASGAPIGQLNTTTVAQNSTAGIPTSLRHSFGHMYIMYSNQNYISAVNGNLTVYSIQLPFGSYTSGLNGIYDNITGYTYVASAGSQMLLLKNGQLSETITLPGNSTNIVGMLYDPANGYVYVENSGGGASCGVFIMSGAGIVGSVKLPACPTGPAAYDSRNGYVYVGTSSTLLDYNYVIALNGTSVAGWILVDGAPNSIIYNSYDNYIYSLNVSSGIISVLSGTKRLSQISSPGAEYLMYNPHTGYVYAPVYSGSNKGFIAVINNTRSFANIPIGSQIYSMQYNPSDGYVYAFYDYNGNIGASQISGITVSSSLGLGDKGVSGALGVRYGYSPSTATTYLYVTGPNEIIGLKGINYLGTAPLNATNSTVTCFGIGVCAPPAAIFGYNPLNRYTYAALDGNLYLVNGTTIIDSLPIGMGAINMTFGS